MKFGILEGLALLGLAIGGFALFHWHQGPAGDADVRWHEGALLERDIRYSGGRSSTRSLVLAVEGLGFRLSHSRGMPRHDALDRALRAGDRLRVAFDARDGWGNRRLYGLERDGETLLAAEAVREWDRGDRRWGLVVGLFLVLCGLFLGALPVSAWWAERSGGRA